MKYHSKTGCAIGMTSQFHMSQGRMLKVLGLMYGKWWIIAAFTGMTALLTVSILMQDLRWLITALMWIFIIMPMMTAFFYINYSLHPDVAFNVLPHTLCIEGNHILIDIYAKDGLKDDNGGNESPESENEKRDKSDEGDEGDEGDATTPEVIRQMKIYRKDVGAYRVSGNYVIITMKSRRGFIYLPLTAFSSSEEMLDFIRRVYE